jgi:hypothetical protein
LLIGVQVRIGYPVDFSRGLWRHKPSPLTAASEPSPNGSYTKRLLGLLERFRMLNLLTFTQQSCRSGFYLEFLNPQCTTCKRTVQKICDGVWRANGSRDHRALSDEPREVTISRF